MRCAPARARRRRRTRRSRRRSRRASTRHRLAPARAVRRRVAASMRKSGIRSREPSSRWSSQRRAERGERHLFDAQRAQQRIVAQPRDEMRSPHDDAGLRTAEQLVAGERDEPDAVGKRLPHRALVRHAVLREVDERAAAEIFDDRLRRRAGRARRARARATSCVKPSIR